MKHIIEVDPGSIEYYVGSNNNRFPFNTSALHRIGSNVSIFKFDRFVISSLNYRKPILIRDFKKYKKVKNYLSCNHFKDSLWYLQMFSELQRDGVTKHKMISITSQKGLEDFFTGYVDKMIISLKRDGWDIGKGKPGNVIVYKDGSLHKANVGDHRFFIAQILDIKPIPVKIKGIHADYNGHELKIDRDLQLQNT